MLLRVVQSAAVSVVLILLAAVALPAAYFGYAMGVAFGVGAIVYVMRGSDGSSDNGSS